MRPLLDHLFVRHEPIGDHRQAGRHQRPCAVARCERNCLRRAADGDDADVRARRAHGARTPRSTGRRPGVVRHGHELVLGELGAREQRAQRLERLEVLAVCDPADADRAFWEAGRGSSHTSAGSGTNHAFIPFDSCHCATPRDEQMTPSHRSGSGFSGRVVRLRVERGRLLREGVAQRLGDRAPGLLEDDDLAVDELRDAGVSLRRPRDVVVWDRRGGEQPASSPRLRRWSWTR